MAEGEAEGVEKGPQGPVTNGGPGSQNPGDGPEGKSGVTV